MEKFFLLQHISKISTLRNHVVFFMCLVCALKVSAMTDVTKRYLENADFSEGPVVSVQIITYENYVTGDAVFGLQDVLGWKKSIVADDPESPRSGMAGGVVAYGSSNLPAPATGYDGKDTGNCLCFWAVWGCGSYYYQDVTLPAGRYTLTIPVYNASGTKAYESYIGFLSEEGTSYVISGTPSVGKWTTLTTTFLLTEETRGKIALGYQSSGEGSSVAPQLYFDYVKIEYEEWVDYTSHIQNPGFDEDISFNNDGSAAKEYVYSYDWGDEIEGWLGAMHYSADGSIYNEDKCGKQGTNAAGLPNWDGFKATIRGWETTNKNDSAIWIYYGCIPYNLGKGMMQLGGGVDGTGDVTEKPSAIATEDNTGVLYLKAGWQNACTYKQTVRKLPTAKYRLTYFIRNTNVDKSRLYAEATNLCNVTCNGVSFVDNEGFNSKGWIKHSIEFVPVDSFSVEFGCRASNDYSYNNPILWVDGIELHKIGVAEEDDIDNAYSELVVKVDSLAGVMHFAADKAALQSAITTFNTDKDYVALYQAILKAEASERKYHEIISIESVFQIIADSLDIVTEVPYGVAKDIVQYAFDKTSAWMASSTATYLDADTWITQLNAYANVYAPMYIEAEQFVNNEEGIRAEKVRNLMASQRTALIESDLKTPLIVDQFIKALRQAMGMQEQELDCSSLPVLTYGDAAYTLPANTKEELTLVWTCSNNEVATINGNLLTINGAGTTIVTATQAGNEYFLPFKREFTLTVTKAALTITADDKTKQQGKANPALTVSYQGFKYHDNASSLIKQPIVTTTATVNSPAGTYPITVSGAESGNYDITYVAGSLTVTEVVQEQSLTLENLPMLTYGDAAYTLPSTTEEGLTLTWGINNNNVAEINGNILTVKSAGTATVTATQAGNDSYLPFSREFTLTVAKAALTITANDCTRKRGEENPELTVSYDGFKNGDTKAVLKKQPTVTTTATVDSPTGEYPIIVSGAEADNYIINYVNGKLTVTPADTPVLTGNTLYVTDGFSVHQGENATLSIRLDNEDDMIMVEFYLQLPEGMHVNKDADGYFDVTLNSERADRTHTVEVEQGTNGLYHVLAYSSRNKAFTGSEGELISMNIGCDANVGAGIYQGVLRSILMSKADKTAVEQGNRTFDIEVTDYILGDVNDDRRINGLDIVEIVDLVMGMGYKPAADLYPVGQPDGIVNGMDLVEEVSLVLSQTIDVTNGARQAESTPLLLGLMLTPTMNGSYDLGVNTADHFILAQLTLKLSDGMTLSDIETDGLHVAAYRPMGEGRYSVVVYSARNRSFIDNRQLLTLRCTGEGEVCVSDVMLIDDVKQARHFAAIGTGETTGIYGIKSSGSGIDTPVYDLQGRKVTIGRKGVYLMGSQKVVVR